MNDGWEKLSAKRKAWVASAADRGFCRAIGQ